MRSNLARIGDKARKEPQLRFTSVYHHVTELEHSRTCFERISPGKAPGVDGVGKKEYAEHLEDNLKDLSGRLRRMGYRPQPVRRTYIDKPGSPKKRPLGIPCLEDKIVQRAVKEVLEPIYEADFLACSYGYRPGRTQHQALGKLGRAIQQKWINWVVDADIQGFFDHVNHDWLIQFLGHRLGDPRVLRLIRRMLKSGVMEDGLVQASE